MAKLQMNLEIIQALNHFSIDTEYYPDLKGFYGSAEALHNKLGELFEVEPHDASAALLNVIEQTNAKGYKPPVAPTLKLKDINARIDEMFPGLYLVAGHEAVNGNFLQLTSDNEKIAADIARLPVQRIYVKNLADLTVEQWLSAIQELIDLEPRG